MLDGGSANHLIVVCRSSGAETDRQGLSIVVVDAKAEGVVVKNNLLLDGSRAANIEFQDVVVSQEDLIGPHGQGADTLDKVYAQSSENYPQRCLKRADCI